MASGWGGDDVSTAGIFVTIILASVALLLLAAFFMMLGKAERRK